MNKPTQRAFFACRLQLLPKHCLAAGAQELCTHPHLLQPSLKLKMPVRNSKCHSCKGDGLSAPAELLCHSRSSSKKGLNLHQHHKQGVIVGCTQGTAPSLKQAHCVWEGGKLGQLCHELSFDGTMAQQN